jgi:hypothetical protein
MISVFFPTMVPALRLTRRMNFGKPLVSGRRSKVTTIEDVSEEGDGVDVMAAELEGMLDSDVSYHWHSLTITLCHSFQAFFCGMAR